MSVSASAVVDTQRAKRKRERNTRVHVSGSADAHVDTQLKTSRSITGSICCSVTAWRAYATAARPVPGGPAFLDAGIAPPPCMLGRS